MNKYFKQSFILKVYNSELIKNSFVLFSGSVIAQALSVLMYPVLSRIYSPEQFGTFALFMSVTSVAAILGTGVYEQAIILPKSENQAWLLVLLCTAHFLYTKPDLSFAYYFFSSIYRRYVTKESQNRSPAYMGSIICIFNESLFHFHLFLKSQEILFIYFPKYYKSGYCS